MVSRQLGHGKTRTSEVRLRDDISAPVVWSEVTTRGDPDRDHDDETVMTGHQ